MGLMLTCLMTALPYAFASGTQIDDALIAKLTISIMRRGCGWRIVAFGSLHIYGSSEKLLAYFENGAICIPIRRDELR